MLEILLTYEENGNWFINRNGVGVCCVLLAVYFQGLLFIASLFFNIQMYAENIVVLYITFLIPSFNTRTPESLSDPATIVVITESVPLLLFSPV